MSFLKGVGEKLAGTAKVVEGKLVSFIATHIYTDVEKTFAKYT